MLNFVTRRQLIRENARLKAQLAEATGYLGEILSETERPDTRDAAQALLERIKAGPQPLIKAA